MPPTSPIAALQLPEAARYRLDSLVESMVNRISNGLAEREASTPVIAVALLYTEDDDHPLVENDYACTERSIADAFEADVDSGLELLWSPPEWDIQDFTPDPPAEEDSLAARVGEDLRAAGVASAKGLVLQEVAWRLSRVDPTRSRLLHRDFAAWAALAEPAEDVAEQSYIAAFRRTANPTSLLAYEAQGRLRTAESDGPRPRLPGADVLPWTATGPRTETEGDAQRLVDSAASGIRQVLRDRRKGRSWAAVAVEVSPTRDPGELLTRSIVLCPRASRSKILKSVEGHALNERIEALWDPKTWAGTGAHRGGRVAIDASGFEDWERRTYDVLRDAGIDDPHTWFALEACRHLNHETLDNVDAKFVAIPLVGRTTGESIAALRTVTPAATLTRLEDDELLAPPS